VTSTPMSAYALVGLTTLVAFLVSIVVFAMLRFMAAARDSRKRAKDSGEMTVLSSALHDAVAKLKAQERATAARADASERLSDEIISSLTAGLLVVDLDAKIRILNPAGRRMLGSADSEALGDYHKVLAEPLARMIDECLSTRTPIRRRTVKFSTDAGDMHLGVTVSPLFDDRSELHGAVCLFSDLTAVKSLEEQLRLKESLATVGELTAGIAHEFRNGLATIHGYSKLIDLHALPDSYRPYVEGIRAETEAMTQMVTNFLNFARPAQLVLSPIDLRAVCERAAEEIRPEARALGGEIELRGEFGTLEGDEVLLRQAFSNLLRNAVEACAGAAVIPTVVIQSEVDAGQKISRIAVHDNGPGVEPAARERIFHPFFTSKRNGTGLGLAVVMKIIVFHNGRIGVATSPQGGASMQITLPVPEASAVAALPI
jgi:PAS domain S-box-containing protein